MTSTHAVAALAVYFAIVLALTALPSREIRSPWVQLVRVALPSWRFFEDLGDVPRLRYRCGPTEDTLGAWQPALPPQARGLRRLLFNPDGNLALAHDSLLHQLWADVADREEGRADDLEDVVSYRLVRNWVAALAQKDGAHAYQLTLEITSASAEGCQEALTSPVYPC